MVAKCEQPGFKRKGAKSQMRGKVLAGDELVVPGARLPQALARLGALLVNGEAADSTGLGEPARR